MFSRYGINRDPFTGPSEEAGMVLVPSVEELAGRFIDCLRDGQGIAVLTAGPGLGKTALCRELSRRLAGEFVVCHLRDASYTTRRALLQSILHELRQPYAGLTEQEARLQLIDFVRDQHPGRQGLVLLVDEAHRLNDRLLEELRSLANFDQAGAPLVRLLLCGGPELEERLIDPALGSISARVLSQQVLEPLTQEETARLIDGRIMQAGGDGWEHVFARGAMELLCLASDGSPRNALQLASRSLQLGAARREGLVSLESMRDALEELKELPLQWNEPAALEPDLEESAETERSSVAAGADWMGLDDEFELDQSGEVEGTMQEHETATAVCTATIDLPEAAVFEFGGGKSAVEITPPVIPRQPVVLAATAAASWTEIDVDDRYAVLDRLGEGPGLKFVPPLVHAVRPPAAPHAAPAPHPSVELEQTILRDVRQIAREVAAATTVSPRVTESWSVPSEWDIIEPEVAGAQPAPGLPVPTLPVAEIRLPAAGESLPQPEDSTPVEGFFLEGPTAPPAGAGEHSWGGSIADVGDELEEFATVAEDDFLSPQEMLKVIPAAPVPEITGEETYPLSAANEDFELGPSEFEIPTEKPAPRRSTFPSLRIDQAEPRPFARMFSRLRRLRESARERLGVSGDAG